VLPRVILTVTLPIDDSSSLLGFFPCTTPNMILSSMSSNLLDIIPSFTPNVHPTSIPNTTVGSRVYHYVFEPISASNVISCDVLSDVPSTLPCAVPSTIPSVMPSSKSTLIINVIPSFTSSASPS